MKTTPVNQRIKNSKEEKIKYRLKASRIISQLRQAENNGKSEEEIEYMLVNHMLKERAQALSDVSVVVHEAEQEARKLIPRGKFTSSGQHVHRAKAMNDILYYLNMQKEDVIRIIMIDTRDPDDTV